MFTRSNSCGGGGEGGGGEGGGGEDQLRRLVAGLCAKMTGSLRCPRVGRLVGYSEIPPHSVTSTHQLSAHDGVGQVNGMHVSREGWDGVWMRCVQASGQQSAAGGGLRGWEAGQSAS